MVIWCSVSYIFRGQFSFQPPIEVLWSSSMSNGDLKGKEAVIALDQYQDVTNLHENVMTFIVFQRSIRCREVFSKNLRRSLLEIVMKLNFASNQRMYISEESIKGNNITDII